MWASELRGISWQDVDLTNQVIKVRRRTDGSAIIGLVKSQP